ncbi:hypothetical protein SAMN05660909_02075 [Chitinophaga terrae (ex Kim and Jung 2007)]|uniref:Uncharacterized protein n=1 Tax=Chitinophaga terrae (ex Kim and Jung 2007) TaxID=408074 RepID=A0A1H4BI82_9BACT|nr:TonB-dependent receptor [Chitinophaga terrae (ex Kim and Jung 2007)]GEP89567.1 hypothetical protein CTE07_12120 [Chitinophaga terrae (ex Kim and Jung 2007)]SEA47744.1 hypothetical protein SAMN05660909_02075 [Chitinophaga terrae (ex Kim and Jung 2007)]
MNTLKINQQKTFFLAAIAAASLLPGSKANAQETLKQETIDIISTNQPKLRDAYKLNLTASLPSVDTSRPVLKYQIPALNLNFMYQATPLKPLALGRDSLGNLQNNFVKLGYGNLQTPYVQAGFGSGRHENYNYGLYVNYTGSKDQDLEDKKYSNLNVLASGTYLTEKLKFDASLGYDRNTVHYYGYNHDTASFKTSDLAQTFNQVTAAVGVENRPQNDWAFTFKPDVKFILFNDSYKRTENTFQFKIPIRKQVFEDIYVGAEGVFDLSTYKVDNGKAINNNIVAIHPAVDIIKPGFVLHAGVNPTWSNGQFKLLPDIVNESHLIKKKLILSSGWISYFEKNSYRNLANKNPFLAGLADDMLNTRVEEKYTGIKGTLGSHFNYNTKFAAVTWYDQPLFINDTLDSKRFITVNETMLRAFQLHAEIGYIEEEKFQVRVSFDWYNYNKQEKEVKPWHLAPFQGDLFAQYTIGRKFHLKADLFALSGSYYLLPNKDFDKTSSAWDLNAGASYDIGKNFGLWVNANNIFNSHYQRYYLYPTYGFNIVGGVMIKF